MKQKSIIALLLVFLAIGGTAKGQTIVIDGQPETDWNASERFQITNLVKNGMGDDGPAEEDLSGNFRALWDASGLLLFVAVTDDVIFHGVTDRDHHNDNIEVYLDPNNSKLSVYDGVDDDQIRFIPQVDTINSKRGITAGQIEFAYAETDTGYNVEMRLPWNVIAEGGFLPAAGTVIGLDLMITDNDEGSTKDYILAWHALTNSAYADASVFGSMKMNSDGSFEDVSGIFQPAEHDLLDIDESRVSSVIYVDVDHPDASDTHPGSNPVYPLKTLQQAVNNACDSAGSGVPVKILLANGVYREHGLNFIRTGNPYDFMNSEIVIEGETPGEVIICGSELMNEGWNDLGGDTYRHAWSWNFEPYRAWGEHGPAKGGQRREMLFVDGRRLTQVLAKEDLVDHSFYIDDDAGTVTVKVSSDTDFNGSDKEVALHGDDETLSWPPGRLLVIPSEKDKVVLRNLVFQHATMRLSEAMLRFYGWKVLVDNCVIRFSNGHGITLSSDSKHIEFRNTHMDHNGACGMFTWGTSELVLDGCTTSHNNWRGHAGGLHSYSVAGIKFHHTTDVMVSNHTADSNWAHGLWTDLEVFRVVFDNCTVRDNYGAGYLVEISKEIEILNSTIERNIPGIRCHSSRNVTIDGCAISGNCVQFTVYRDHRDFSDANWTGQFEGRVWDKTPRNWTIRNSTITATDEPDWQAWAENRMPYWMNYENPGYQPLWHFSHADFMQTFFREADIAYNNNTWIHPVSDKPFTDDAGNALNTAEWEAWISGVVDEYAFLAMLDTMAMEDDASGLTIGQLEAGGMTGLVPGNLDYYRRLIEEEARIEAVETVGDIIKKANAFAEIRAMATGGDASALTTGLLDDCDMDYDPDRMEEYRLLIGGAADIAGLEDLQALLNSVGIAAAISESLFRLWPNPARQVVHISGHDRASRLELLDASGRTIWRSGHPSGFTGEITVGHLNNGIYMVRCFTKNGIYHSKFIKE